MSSSLTRRQECEPCSWPCKAQGLAHVATANVSLGASVALGWRHMLSDSMCTLFGERYPPPPRRNYLEVFKRGWRTEGVGAMRSFLCQRLRPLFCALFSRPPPQEKGTTILGISSCCAWAPASRQPLFEASELLHK